MTDWGGQGPDLDTCTREVDHAMLLVGYGEEEPEEGGREFWVLKNTWGTTWGEAGYMRMLRRGGGEARVDVGRRAWVLLGWLPCKGGACCRWRSGRH